MRKILTVLFLVGFSTLLLAQTTAIPDPKFEQALIDLKYDENLDGSVSTANISEVTKLEINGKGITDLSGIEGFTALVVLRVNNNNLVDLDLKQNTALTHVGCANNKLTKLDLTQNKLLRGLYCNNNELISLETNISVESVGCGANKLTNLDVSKSTALKNLLCGNNNLTDLNLSKNIGLIRLHCDSNQLISLDLTHNNILKYMYCDFNLLTSLDFTQNKYLKILNCESNKLTSLDLTQNENLRTLSCGDNKLTSLDLTKNRALDDETKINSQFDLVYSDDNPYNGTLKSFESKEVDYVSLVLPTDLKNSKIVYVNIPYAKRINGAFAKRMKKYPYQFKITNDENDVLDCKYRIYMKRGLDLIYYHTMPDILQANSTAPVKSQKVNTSKQVQETYIMYLENLETGENYKLPHESDTYYYTFRAFVKTAISGK